MDLLFESIVEGDVPELTRVMMRAFDDDTKRHLGVERGGPPGYDDGGFFREWLFGYEWTVGYKVISADRIVGAVIVWIFATGENHVGTIFVDPEYQNLGVGKRIWAFVESTYPEASSWQLETPSFASKNHHFYETCGFRKTGAKPGEGDMPGEFWVYKKDVAQDDAGHAENSPGTLPVLPGAPSKADLNGNVSG